MALPIVKKIKPNREFTKEELKHLFPKRKRGITDDVVKEINKLINMDPDVEGLSQSIIDNATVLDTIQVSMIEYVNAVRFAGFILDGQLNTMEAYIRTFPDKDHVKEYIKQKESGKEVDPDVYNVITAASSRFKRSKIVSSILKQNLIPAHLMYMGMRNDAIHVLYDTMYNAKSDKVRVDAADTLLKHTEPPKEAKVELDVKTSEDDTKAELLAQLQEAIKQQKALIEQGVSLEEAQKLNIKHTEVVDAEVEEDK